MANAAEQSIGHGRHRQKEWFAASADSIQPFVDAKNTAWAAMLQCGTDNKRREFRRCQRAVAMAVKEAKENWISDLASRAEEAVANGRVRWGCIKSLRSTFSGWQSTSTASILDENGNPLSSQDDILPAGSGTSTTF